MSDQSFHSIHLAEAQRNLASVFQQVAQSQGRLEIKRDDGQQACVLISKAELESLERALEILSDAQGVKDLCASLERLAHLSHDQYCAV